MIYGFRSGILHPDSRKMHFCKKIKKNFLVLRKKALYLYPGSIKKPTARAGSRLKNTDYDNKIY